MAVARLQQHDMEPLSPRSPNIQIKAKPSEQKAEKEMANEEAKMVEAARKAAKEKEYAPSPPEWVIQPPLVKGGLAEKFKTGRLLGKGGFAIAYEGELRSKTSGGNRSVFALKIVQAKMSQKKMEEKVKADIMFLLQVHSDPSRSFGLNCRFTQKCVIRTLWSSTEHSHTERARTSY